MGRSGEGVITSVERIRGKKRRPSPENSRSLRKEWGRIEEVRVWRVREMCLSKVVRRLRRDGWGCGAMGVFRREGCGES